MKVYQWFLWPNKSVERSAYGLPALMTLVEVRPISLSSSGLVKMEERKRPASYDHDDSAPPYKRQATTVNGAPKGHNDADMPGKDELEVSLAVLYNSVDTPNKESAILPHCIPHYLY